MSQDIERIIWKASAENKPVHVGHIRSYCKYDFELVSAVKLAERLGVKVLGFLKYSEQKQLLETK